MLNNWGNNPCYFSSLDLVFSSSCCCFPCSGCLTCQWVTTRSKIWLTCFMWHFNFLSVNQRGCCIFLIAPLEWQLNDGSSSRLASEMCDYMDELVNSCIYASGAYILGMKRNDWRFQITIMVTKIITVINMTALRMFRKCWCKQK